MKVETHLDAERFKSFSILPNHMLLCHGTRVENVLGILRRGLTIAPPEAPSSGQLFGKGIYFADLPEKSAHYCSYDSLGHGILLLCEVALGDRCLLYTPSPIFILPRGKHSIFGRGKRGTLGSSYLHTDDGMMIPTAEKPIDNCRKLDWNEFVVYNEGQVRIRYIVRIQRAADNS